MECQAAYLAKTANKRLAECTPPYLAAGRSFHHQIRSTDSKMGLPGFQLVRLQGAVEGIIG